MTCGIVGASSDQAILLFLEEVTFGTLQTAVTYNSLRFVSEDFRQETGTTISSEIDGTRRTTDIIRTSVSATGDMAIELSYGGHDSFWEALLQSSDWTTASSLLISATFATGPDTITDAAADFVAAGFLVNQIIKVRDAVNAQNNAYCKLTNVATTVLTVEVISGSQVFTAEAATAGVTVVQGDYITDGATCRAFSFEEELTDLTNVFKQFLGMSPATGNLTIPADGVVTGAFGFSGVLEQSAASSAASAANGADSSGTANVMNSIDNLLVVTEALTNLPIISFAFDVNNNLRTRLQAGTVGPVSLGAGKLELTGSLTAFFSTVALFDKYLNFTETEIKLILQDLTAVTGGAYAFDIPALRFTSGQRVAGGINTDIIADMQWTAKVDSAENVMMRIARFDLAEIQ